MNVIIYAWKKVNENIFFYNIVIFLNSVQLLQEERIACISP